MSVVDCSAKSDHGNVEKMTIRCSVRGGVCDLEITIWAKPNTGTSARVRPDQEGPPGEEVGQPVGKVIIVFSTAERFGTGQSQ